MKVSVSKNQRGIAHVGLIVLAVIILGIVGFAGWKVFGGKKGGDSAGDKISRAAIEAACTEEDKNICKFQASWKEQKYYTIKTTSTSEGTTTESTYRVEGDDKFHMSSTGENAYEMISIGKTTYTKAPNGVWWKQTLKDGETAPGDVDFSFDDTEDTTEEKDEPKPTYKNLGTEACGNLTCFKYQIIDNSPDDKEHTEYIWFDNKDYQLRKQRTESADGSTSESTFSYDKISIKEPNPVKELGPDQYLVPGQNEPTSMPTEQDMQDYMNSFPAYTE